MESMQLEEVPLPINGNGTDVAADMVVEGLNGLKVASGGNADGDHQPNGHVNGDGEVAGPSKGPAANIAPSYDDIFPALGGGAVSGGGLGALNFGPGSLVGKLGGGANGPAIRPQPPRVRTSKVGKRYVVHPGQRADRAGRPSSDDYGLRIARNIMSRTGTEIELTSSKDGTLTFLVNGREEGVNQALRMLASEFEAQLKRTMNVPREYHRIILGKQGKKLLDLEQATGTRIQLPRIGEEGEGAESVSITGTKEAIDKAMAEIRHITVDAASRTFERFTVAKIYHPFIFGPFNETLNEICAQTGAKVNVPPPNVQRDEIAITGEKNAVMAAKDRVLAIVNQKEKTCKTAAVEVKKTQHKYVIGPKGATLNEILRQTGVSVEVPPPEVESDTITLRGEPTELGKALSIVNEKAYSEMEEVLNVPGWIQRNILGPKGVRFQELELQFQGVQVGFEIEQNLIKLSGPVRELQKAKQLLCQRADQINAEMKIEEIPVADPKHIKFIVGKNGSNLKQIRDETQANIQVITDGDQNNNHSSGSSKKSSASSSPAHQATTTTSSSSPTTAARLGPQFVRIEGTKEAVDKAKSELESLLNKLENEVSYELIIERRFYGQIIGPKGENIRDIRNKFNQVNITFPEPNGSSDKVLIRGPKKDAEQAYKHLSQLSKELLFNNYRIEVPIYSQLLKFLQSKDSIKKIREEIGVRVDLPQQGNGSSGGESSDVITITGQKDKVEQAKGKLLSVINSMSDISHVDILIPAKIHNYMLGARGRNIKSIMAECGGVYVNFPPEGSGSDKVQIMGPKDCVTKAKAMLVAMSNDYQTNNYNEELNVKIEHHRYLIGRAGASISRLREQCGNVRIYFSSDSPSNTGKVETSPDQERIIITGKKEDVAKARKVLEEKIKELDKIVEDEVQIEQKWHHLFVSRRAALINQLSSEYGGVSISFPKIKEDSSRVSLKGSKECVQQVKQRMLEIVADHEAQVTIDVHIDAQYHRQLLSRVSGKVNQLQQDFNVRIKFPARPRQEGNGQGPANGDEEGNATPEDDRANTVTISGHEANCAKAKEALLALVPIVEVVSIPYEFHRYIIGQKGAEVRALMDKCNVNIRVPPTEERSNDIQVIGSKEAVEEAKKELAERAIKLEEEKVDREARSFIVTVQVDPLYHPKIIGKRGIVISKLRQKFDVNIQMPEAGGAAEGGDVITIQGYEKKANECREEILRMVKELEDMVTQTIEVDHRVHSRLIGSRGKNIKQIMDDYKVDIRFPRTGDSNPNLVTIMGTEEAVEDCKEHLLDLVDEYLDDVALDYKPPASHGFQINFEELSTTGVKVKETSKGFQVRGGPWEKNGGGVAAAADNGDKEANGAQRGKGGVDMDSAQEFPAFGLDNSSQVNGGASVWGPKRN